jgi:hypothetical protein
MLVEAAGDRLVVDLVRHPRIAGSPRWDRALAVIEPLLGVRRVGVDAAHLDVELEAFPEGVQAAWSAVRRVL